MPTLYLSDKVTVFPHETPKGSSMNPFIPVPLEQAAYLARKHHTKDDPATWVEGWIVLWWWMWTDQPWSIRQIADFTGWGKTKAKRLLNEVKTAYGQTSTLKQSGTATGHERDTTGTEPGHKRDTTPQQVREVTPPSGTRTGHDRDKTGTQTGRHARDPLVRDRSRERSDHELLFADLLSTQLQHEPKARELEYRIYSKRLAATVKALGGGTKGREQLKLIWRWWYTGPDVWWRTTLKGAKAMGALLRPTKVQDKLEAAKDWEASGGRKVDDDDPLAGDDSPFARRMRERRAEKAARKKEYEEYEKERLAKEKAREKEKEDPWAAQA